MPRATANAITIHYETTGRPGDAPVLLINGFSHQLTYWHPDLVRSLADSGYFVICFDNRDVGLSTWLDPEPEAGDVAPGSAATQYSISDMAADAVGLLDFLGLESAHVVGYSLGGMIGQTMAIEHPERVRSLVSISSTTGSPVVGQTHPDVLAALVAPSGDTRADVVELNLRIWRIIGSPAYPLDEWAIADFAGRGFDRAFHPAGAHRQFLAIMLQPDRTEALGAVIAPTLVIHGDSDVMVNTSGGIATAAAIPGARLRLVPGLGHDIHPDLHEELVRDLTEHFARADQVTSEDVPVAAPPTRPVS